MKLTLESLGEAFRAYYDRLIAFLAIVALLVSLVLLMMRLGGIKAEEQRFQSWQQNLAPAFASATNATLEVFVAGHQKLAHPFQIVEWKKNLSAPELRIFCMDCERPIPYNADECPWCKAKVREVPTTRDKDDDRMDDEWEVAHGLNPLDADDGKSDPDKDGFSNLEEFNFKTNPNDPVSHPPLIAKLRVAEIKAMPFHLKFMAVNKLTGGDIYQINSTKSGKTSWYKMGEAVEGYSLTEFKPVIVNTTFGQGEMKMDQDRSVLTLKSKIADRLIALQKGETVPVSEYEVKFLLEIDSTEIRVKHGADFDLRGSLFTVKEIDNKAYRVLIVEKDTGKETWIGRQAETVITP
ncbi:MAG: Amuc_1099 family pilus-like system protein [Kiritimatiellia bacterium]